MFDRCIMGEQYIGMQNITKLRNKCILSSENILSHQKLIKDIDIR